MSTYQRLRDMVVSGEVDQSRRISESSLATTLAVSRTPVREALQRLESDGLVFAAGRGVQVRVLSTDELDEVLEARAALEGAAVARLADRVHAGEVAPARLAELDQLADLTHALSRAGKVGEAVQSNRRFHEGVVRLAGNNVIITALERFWDQILIATRAGLEREDRVGQVDAEHRQVLAAIRAGDAALARNAAEAHITATRTTLRKAKTQP